jgi:hypothetical protein
MNKNEITKLRKQIHDEIEKRKKINHYLDNEVVQNYLKLIGESTDKKEVENIREILVNILRNFEVKSTNGIYVCTKAYDEDNSAPILYPRTPEGKGGVDCKCYMDIESKKEVVTNCVIGPSIYDFEKRNIVLNPYNAPYNDKKIVLNGFEEVRLDFFEECYKNGQYKAVQKVLSKYPRI